MDENRQIEAAVRFEVLVNGQLTALSGITGKGRLQATLAWNEREKPQLFLLLSGMERASGDLVTWDLPAVKPGDEISIRILGPGACNDGVRIAELPGDGR